MKLEVSVGITDPETNEDSKLGELVTIVDNTDEGLELSK